MIKRYYNRLHERRLVLEKEHAVASVFYPGTFHEARLDLALAWCNLKLEIVKVWV